MIHAKNVLLHTLTFKNLSMLKKLFVNVVKLFHLESIIKCLGKVITFYEKCGQGHSWVEKPAGF